MGENDPSAYSGGVAGTLLDSVGANTLTTVGGPFYDTNVSAEASARVGSTFAVNFFSGGLYASGALLTNVTDNFGLEGWVKPTSTSGNHCLMYSGNTGNSGWGVMQVGNTFQGLFGGVTFFGSGAVSLNTWTHVALVRNAGTATLYVNGVSAGTTTSTPNASSGKFAIGSSPPTLIADFISGYADEVRFFTFAAGQFTTNDLLRMAPNIAVAQPAGTSLSSGGSRDFGTVATGANASLTFTVTNTGVSDLNISAASIDGTDASQFAVTASPRATVTSGATITFTLRFAPVTGGSKTAAFHLISNDPDTSPFNITLTGSGAPPHITIEQPAGTSLTSGGSRDFGMMGVGTNASLTFTVKNTGVSTLNISATSIDGTDASQFTVTASPGATVTPGGSTTFTLQFAPTSGGSKTAAFHLVSNDPVANPFNITLTGLGASPVTPTVSNVTAFSANFSTSENLFAAVNPNYGSTTVSFQYGLTTSYGSVLVATNLPVISSTIPITATVTGLTPGTLYHYRVVAANSAGSLNGTDMTFTTRNDAWEVRAYYRMGEMDGTNFLPAVPGSQSTLIFDSAAGHHVPVVNPSTYGDGTITSQPVYSANVAASAAGDAGSSCSFDIANGQAYGLAPVFYPGTDNFCLEAWVKPGLLSGNQYIIYNGSAANGWGLEQKGNVFQAITLTTSWANYTGEDIGSGQAILGQWTHIALVSNNGVPTFYVNGIPTGNAIHPLNLQGGNFTIGKGPVFANRFGGQMDEIRLSTFPAGQFSVTNLLLKSIPPAVTSPTSASLTTTTAVLGGTVTGQGGTPVTERGIVYSISSVNANPVIGGAGVVKVIAPGTNSVFTALVSGLTPGTTYSYRPYAINTFGPVYGPVAGFSTVYPGFTPLIYYRFGESDPGAVAGGVATNTLDSAGTNDLPLTGSPVYSTDTPANQNTSLSLNFGNGTAYGSRPILQTPLDNFGFEAWVKPATNSGSHCILYNGNLGSSGWGMLQNGGTYQVLFGGIGAFGSGPAPLNQWTHLAVVRNNGVSTFYVNGVASGTTPLAPALPSGNFAVGADPGNLGASRWVGNLDQVRVFAFPAGQFSLSNLFFIEPEIALEQPPGTGLANGGTRDVGSPAVGSSSDLTFTVKNIGNTNLTGLGISIDGTDAAMFSVVTSPVVLVAAGGSTTFTVRFTPTSSGLKTAALHLNNNDPNQNPFNINLTAALFVPKMIVESSAGMAITNGGSQDVGSVNVGTNTNLTFTIRNIGNVPLNLTGAPKVVVGGTNAADFTVTAQPASPVDYNGPVLTNSGFETPAQSAGGYAYAPSGSGWAFNSMAGVAGNGSPWFVNAAPEGVQTAFVQNNNSGAGTISRTVTFPTPGDYVISFFMVRRGAANLANDIALTLDGVTLGTVLNTSQPDDIWRTFNIPCFCPSAGAHTLAFVGTRGGGGDYASAIDSVQIAGGATTFQVNFAPTAGGLRSATLSIANNDNAQNPYSFTLTGTGIAPQIAVQQPGGTAIANGGTRDFGTVKVGTNTNLTFTILSTGGVNLVLTGTPKVAVGGANAADFTVTSQPASPVNSGGAIPITNSGFETPAQSAGGFTYQPGGAVWTFGNKAGLARNGSPWFVNPAPEGLQAAYIQLNSAGAILSQPVNFPTLGNYVISFSMVRRGSGLQANDIAVSMDGVTLGTVLNTSQPDDIWRTFSIPYNCTVTGNHTLAFVGTRGGADNASAIDNVQISGGVGTTAFQVSFTPTAGGLRTATLSIANNDSTQNPFGIILDGTGVAPVPPVINAQSLAVSGNGTFQFTFTNTNNFAFSVLATTNASLPVSNWTVLGAPTNLGGGLYQFADPAATNFPFRFYQLRFP